MFSGLCLRRKKWAAVRSSGQNRVQRVEIKMRNDAQERETTEAWGPVGRKRGRSTKKGEFCRVLVGSEGGCRAGRDYKMQECWNICFLDGSEE